MPLPVKDRLDVFYRRRLDYAHQWQSDPATGLPKTPCTNTARALGQTPLDLAAVELERFNGGIYVVVVSQQKAVFMMRFQPQMFATQDDWSKVLFEDDIWQHKLLGTFPASLWAFCRYQQITQADYSNNQAVVAIIAPQQPGARSNIPRDQGAVSSIIRGIRGVRFRRKFRMIMPKVPIRLFTYQYAFQNLVPRRKTFTILFRYDNDNGVKPKVSSRRPAAGWQLWLSGTEKLIPHPGNETVQKYVPALLQYWPQKASGPDQRTAPPPAGNLAPNPNHGNRQRTAYLNELQRAASFADGGQQMNQPNLSTTTQQPETSAGPAHIAAMDGANADSIGLSETSSLNSSRLDELLNMDMEDMGDFSVLSP